MQKWTTTIIATAVPLLATVASACPMCKDSVANGTEPGQGPALARGFNLSIYIMLIGFLGTLALVTMTLVRGVRSQQSVHTPSKDPAPNLRNDEPDKR